MPGIFFVHAIRRLGVITQCSPYQAVTAYCMKYCLKNDQECIIRLKNSWLCHEVLNLITHDCKFFEQFQNL